MNTFELKTGRVIGYSHQQTAQNCQDAIISKQVILNDGQYTVVVLSDGSSVGEDNQHLVHNEVGSILTTDFLLDKTLDYLISYKTPLEILPYFLFDDLIEYYHSLVGHKKSSNLSDLVSYVKHHLLCTVLILIVTPKQGLIMRYGDGVVVINEQVSVFNYDDTPPYIAYHLIPNHLKTNATKLPNYFETIEFDPNNIQRVAIGSDAFTNNLDLIPKFWGHKHPNQIQRNLNIWSKIDHRLTDDATLAVIERIEKP